MMPPLKSFRKVTVVGIKCDDAAFFNYFKKVHTRNCSFKKNLFFFKVLQATWQTFIVDIVKYLY